MMQINFEVNQSLINETKITLTDLNSELWSMYHGAYGDIWFEINTLAKVISGENVEQEELETEFENLCETLWHQMSFYNASYLAMPYMLKLLEQKIEEKDFLWQLRLFSEIGMIVACDIPRNHYGRMVDIELVENYNRCIQVLAEREKQFLMEYFDKLIELDSSDKSYFYTTALAVLDDREASFVLIGLLFYEIYVVCEACGEYNEEMSLFSDSDIEEIEPAKSVIGQWNGKSIENTYVWYSNFLHLLGDEKAVHALSYYYGTYTCPKCGEKGIVMNLAKKYFLEDCL